MTGSLGPPVGSPAGAMHGAAVKGLEAILKAFQEGGKDVKLYHAVLDGPTQVSSRSTPEPAT